MSVLDAPIRSSAEKVLGHPVGIVIRTWLAPGVGPVQSEVLEKSAFGAVPQVARN
jgi:hypothetical protein